MTMSSQAIFWPEPSLSPQAKNGIWGEGGELHFTSDSNSKKKPHLTEISLVRKHVSKTMPSRWTLFDLFIPEVSLVSIFICLQTFLMTCELHSSCSPFRLKILPRQSWPQDLGLLNHIPHSWPAQTKHRQQFSVNTAFMAPSALSSFGKHSPATNSHQLNCSPRQLNVRELEG